LRGGHTSLLLSQPTSHPRFAPGPDPTASVGLVNIAKNAAGCPQRKYQGRRSLFFGAVTYFSDQLRGITKNYSEQTNILIIGSGINFIDVAGCETLVNEAHNLHLNGRQLYLSSLKGNVRDILQRGGYLERIGADHIFPFKEEAIKYLVPHLDPERCRVCNFIFHECGKCRHDL
jgi:SulP family sulfate permease